MAKDLTLVAWDEVQGEVKHWAVWQLWHQVQGKLFTTLHCIGTGRFWEGCKGIDPRIKEVTAVRAADPEEAEDGQQQIPALSCATSPSPRCSCRPLWVSHGGPERRQRARLAELGPPEETGPPRPWGGPGGPLLSALPTQETPETRSRQRAALRAGRREAGGPRGGGAAHRGAGRLVGTALGSPFRGASEVASRGLRLPSRLLAPGDRGHRTGQGGALGLRPARVRARFLISKNSPSAPGDRGKPLEELAGLARRGPASCHLSRSSGSARRPRAPPTFLPGFMGAAGAGSPRGTAGSAAPRIRTSPVRRGRGSGLPYPGVRPQTGGVHAASCAGGPVFVHAGRLASRGRRKRRQSCGRKSRLGAPRAGAAHGRIPATWARAAGDRDSLSSVTAVLTWRCLVRVGPAGHVSSHPCAVLRCTRGRGALRPAPLPSRARCSHTRQRSPTPPRCSPPVMAIDLPCGVGSGTVSAHKCLCHPERFVF
ncbi:collagen alpha-1(I) chain-like [Piliocolobus tephrosceles]|uniref:collagen alpha-1(I) chain-like n=1 Tax=Piliocolobus tephrosceles TaxID=591936 RepID=UPI000C2A30C8|nr:collagen alpha-1(I) chain-like [Piliocolobus tephrosceles]